MTALLRLSGEISTKSRRTRRRFERRLVENLRAAFREGGVRADVEPGWSRLYVTGPAEPLFEILPTVFGISSFSPVEGECEASLPAIVETGRRLYGERVRGRRFAVRARRAGEHDFSSYDVKRELGAALNPGAEVDLDDPEVTVRVEVRNARARLFSERFEGPAGLPLGVQGKALALLSGGFDSAVAAWMAQRRGIEVDYVFCNLGGPAYERFVIEVAKKLADDWSHGAEPEIHVVDFGEVVGTMREEVAESYLQVVLKRLMYRAADRVAGKIDARALVTGESVGQVSSQTLSNLGAIDDAASLPVLRPLVGFDKERIVDLSREIGTYELSARVREYCAIAPDRPVTASSPERARREAAKVPDEALRDAVRGRSRVSLRDVDPAALAGDSLFVSRVPEDAVVLDLRDEEAFREWHWPGARRREYEELAGSDAGLDVEGTYVLCCERGTRSAHLAERLQAEGYEAYSFRGGAGALRASGDAAGAVGP